MGLPSFLAYLYKHNTNSRTMSTTSNAALPLQGKVAIVTGASRGIGAGIAIELARRGAEVGPPSMFEGTPILTSLVGCACLHLI